MNLTKNSAYDIIVVNLAIHWHIVYCDPCGHSEYLQKIFVFFLIKMSTVETVDQI